MPEHLKPFQADVWARWFGILPRKGNLPREVEAPLDPGVPYGEPTHLYLWTMCSIRREGWSLEDIANALTLAERALFTRLWHQLRPEDSA